MTLLPVLAGLNADRHPGRAWRESRRRGLGIGWGVVEGFGQSRDDPGRSGRIPPQG